MRMAKLVACCLALGSLVFLTGCAGYPEYLQRSMKPNINAFTRTDYSASNYEVLGTVKATGESLCILGLYIEGKEGQALLWDDAQGRFAGRFTGIKDINAWNEYKGILPPVFCQIKTTYVGTAVREKSAP